MKTITRTFLLLLAICSLIPVSFTQVPVTDKFILFDAVGTPGASVTIYVEIRNNPSMAGFQFDIVLPQGFSYVAGSSALNPARNCGQILSSNILPGTSILRIIGINLVNCPFPGHSDIILWFSLHTPVQSGIFELIPENVLIGDCMGMLIPTENIPATVFIVPGGPQNGDSNCDGVVNVTDVVTSISFIIGSIPELFCFQNADLNSDLTVDIIDVIGIINLIIPSK